MRGEGWDFTVKECIAPCREKSLKKRNQTRAGIPETLPGIEPPAPAESCCQKLPLLGVWVKNKSTSSAKHRLQLWTRVSLQQAGYQAVISWKWTAQRWWQTWILIWGKHQEGEGLGVYVVTHKTLNSAIKHSRLFITLNCCQPGLIREQT